MQTLLVALVCSDDLGLLPGRVVGNPGRRSLKLACPGLSYAALSGLRKSEEGKPQKHETAAHIKCHSCRPILTSG